jgi:hypothetical protein
VFISIKKWLQTNYLGAAAQLTSNSDARLHFDTLSLLRPLPKSGPLYIKEIEVMMMVPKGSTMVCTCL